MLRQKWFVPGIRSKQIVNDVGVAAVPSKDSKKIDVNAHQKILGHCGEVRMKLTGKSLGYEVMESLKLQSMFSWKGKACSVGKARQTSVNKEWKAGS